VAGPDASTCARCRNQEPVIASARAVGPYEGSLRAIIHALKYDKRQSLAGPLGHLMVRSGEELLPGVDVVVPVPLHRGRRRERGFNQAEELARHLGLPWRRVLRRQRVTRSQADLPAHQRRSNVKDAFAERRGQPIQGLTVLLVDDVSTTGATLEACAHVLRQGGALEVRALTAARVASRPP
jgi:ComF family protein